MCECAWAAVKVRNTYLSRYYYRLRQRRGTKKAIVALARKILTIIYHLLKNGTVYDENQFLEIKQKQDNLRLKRLRSDAKRFGLELISPKIAT